MLCPSGPVPAGTPESLQYPLLARAEVEGLRESLRAVDDAPSLFLVRQLVETTLAAWEQNATVVRFAQEVDADLSPNTMESVRWYMNGYSAARGELRALLGIEER